MTRIERSTTIQAPVQEVFGYAADWRTWGDWFAGVSDFRATTEIIQGNGARYTYKVWMMGAAVTVETEIHDFVRNAGWTGISTKGMPHRTYWKFEPAGTGTRFTYVLEYRLPIPLIGSLLDGLLLRPQWKRIIEKSLFNLKQHFLPARDGIDG